MAKRPIIGVPTQTPRGDPGRAASLLGDEPAVRPRAGAGRGGALDHSPAGRRHRHAARHLRPARRRVPSRRRGPASLLLSRRSRPALCGRTDPDRDATELTLARWAMEDRKPLPGRVPGRAGGERGGRGHACTRTSRRRSPARSSTTISPARASYSRDMLVHEVGIPADTRLGRLRRSAGDPGQQHAPPGHQAAGRGSPPECLRAGWPDRGARVLQRPLPRSGVQWHPGGSGSSGIR